MASERLNTTLQERLDGEWTPYGRYRQHRRDALGRGIKFKLTFEQWCRIWEQSGKWALRGRKRGQYVMARFGDRGPYSVSNVHIITSEQNHIDANRGRPLGPQTAAHKANKRRTMIEKGLWHG